MARLYEPALVAMLNIDAEIEALVERLAGMEHRAGESMAPWFDEARTVLQMDVALLKERRDELYRKLNPRVTGRATIQVHDD
jgi:hypothetical protein